MKLADADLLRLLPAHLSGDAQLATAAEALRPFLGKLSRFIPNLLIYARLGNADCRHFLPPLRRLTEARPGLDPLDMETLESLAWQFHVDFREVARNERELAGMVRDSIAWHRIKGTKASIYAALELCGYKTEWTQDASSRAAEFGRNRASGQIPPSAAQDVRPRGIWIEEFDPNMPWASYQLGFDEIADTADLARIVAICNEMQPARCRLWRVYVDDYDFRPGVWSGPLPKNSWSNAWWSYYSGQRFPDIPGLDDGGLVVSFGVKRKFQAEAYLNGDVGALVWHSQGRAFIIRRLNNYFWSYSRWSDLYPPRHGFVIGELFSTHACERIWESLPWPGKPWPDAPWAQNFRWDRRLHPWRMTARGICKSQGVYSDASDKRPSAWSARNCNWSTPVFCHVDEPPAWSEDDWSGDVNRIHWQIIPEQFDAGHAAQAPAMDPSLSGPAFGASHAAYLLDFGRMPIWSRSSYSQIFPKGHSFIQHCLLAAICGEDVCASQSWSAAPWPARPWGRFLDIEQRRKRHAAIMGGTHVFMGNARTNRQRWAGFMAMALAWKAPMRKPGRSLQTQNMATAAGACAYSSAPWPGKPWPDTAWGKLDGLIWPREKHGAVTGSMLSVQTQAGNRTPGCAMGASARLTAGKPEREAGQSVLAATQPLAGGVAVYSSEAWPQTSWPQEPWGEITNFTREHSAFSAKISAEGA